MMSCEHCGQAFEESEFSETNTLIPSAGSLSVGDRVVNNNPNDASYGLTGTVIGISHPSGYRCLVTYPGWRGGHNGMSWNTREPSERDSCWETDRPFLQIVTSSNTAKLFRTTDDKILCRECLEALDYILCDYCGYYHPADEIHDAAGNKHICDDCIDDRNYEYCEDCGLYHPANSMRRVNQDYYVCIGCIRGNPGRYFTCYECGETRTADRLALHYNGSPVCDDCADEFRECDECGEYVRESEARYDDDTEEWLCDNCYRAEHERSEIHDYNFKPSPRFFTRSGTSDNAPAGYTFGVELEVDGGDNKHNCAAKISEVDEAIYLKHDGSLDCGIEIVTHPCTLDYLTYSFRWKEISRICESYSFKSHDTRTCGLHIHVGRKGLGTNDADRGATAAKIVLLTDRFWPQLVTFSRRKNSALDHWASAPGLSLFDDISESEAVRMALDSSSYTRYKAINLQNRATVEFRLFRGSLVRDTIIAALQLVNNICEYAQTHSVMEVLRAEWKDIIDIHAFTELTAYCTKKKLYGEADDVCATESNSRPCWDAEIPEPPEPRAYQVGDRVRDATGYTGLRGREGEIAIASHGSLGAIFPGWTGGHNLNGAISGTNERSGFWMSLSDLELIAA